MPARCKANTHMHVGTLHTFLSSQRGYTGLMGRMTEVGVVTKVGGVTEVGVWVLGVKIPLKIPLIPLTYFL